MVNISEAGFIEVLIQCPCIVTGKTYVESHDVWTQAKRIPWYTTIIETI